MITSTVKGVFIWYEHCTIDGDAAARFYSRVLGWRSREMKGPTGSYTIVSGPNADVGGIMQLSAEACAAGARPAWVAYIGADDVDAVARKAKELGGSIKRPPEEIPGIGRFAVVADPGGAVFMTMTPLSKEPPPSVPARAPGHVGWRELHAADGDEAVRFYSELYGWAKGDTMEMGEQGRYQVFTIGGEGMGGIMTKMKDSPAPFWMFYFNVDALDAATERVKKNGGQLLNGPMQVPGDNWIANFMDPQGAMFSLIAPKR